MITAIFKGCYPYFSLFALIVMVWRLRRGKWSAKETLIAGVLIIHAVVEILQMYIGAGVWSMSRRYLLPAAPLFFLWTAWGTMQLYRFYRLERYRKYLLILAACFVLLLLYDGMKPALQHRFSAKKNLDVQVLKEAVPQIQKHYHGLKLTKAALHPGIYHSPFLPTVASSVPSLGEACGGRTASALFNDIPDYWVLTEQQPAPRGAVPHYRFRAGTHIFTIYRRR